MKIDYFELSPLSEQTIIKHKFNYKGFSYHNDFGYPCDYRVLKDGKELGRIKYYKGRKLCNYKLVKQ